jgi:hypothetical protein
MAAADRNTVHLAGARQTFSQLLPATGRVSFEKLSEAIATLERNTIGLALAVARQNRTSELAVFDDVDRVSEVCVAATKINRYVPVACVRHSHACWEPLEVATMVTKLASTTIVVEIAVSCQHYIALMIAVYDHDIPFVQILSRMYEIHSVLVVAGYGPSAMIVARTLSDVLSGYHASAAPAVEAA